MILKGYPDYLCVAFALKKSIHHCLAWMQKECRRKVNFLYLFYNSKNQYYWLILVIVSYISKIVHLKKSLLKQTCHQIHHLIAWAYSIQRYLSSDGCTFVRAECSTTFIQNDHVINCFLNAWGKYHRGQEWSGRPSPYVCLVIL